LVPGQHREKQLPEKWSSRPRLPRMTFLRSEENLGTDGKYQSERP